MSEGEQQDRRTRYRQNARQLAGSFQDVLPPETLWLFGIALLLLLIGAFGGLKQVGEKDVEIQTGQVKKNLVVEPFTLNFDRAYTFLKDSDFTQLQPLGPGQRGLLLTVDVTNTSPVPVEASLLADTLRLDMRKIKGYADEHGVKPTMLRFPDLLVPSQLQPGLKTRIVATWVQETATEPPSLKLVLYGHTYRTSHSDGSKAYFDPTAKFRVVMTPEPPEKSGPGAER